MALLRTDPLTVFNFYLTLIDNSSVGGSIISAALNYAVAGFSECSGLEASIEIMEYKEGGENSYVHKFATRASHSNIKLSRGSIFLFDDLWNWHYAWVTGQGTRKDGLIVLEDEGGNPAKIWRFKGGIPMRWTGPALNATQNAVAIESLEIAHQGLELDLGA